MKALVIGLRGRALVEAVLKGLVVGLRGQPLVELLEVGIGSVALSNWKLTLGFLDLWRGMLSLMEMFGLVSIGELRMVWKRREEKRMESLRVIGCGEQRNLDAATKYTIKGFFENTSMGWF